jgi:hypothetical protein
VALQPHHSLSFSHDIGENRVVRRGEPRLWSTGAVFDPKQRHFAIAASNVCDLGAWNR